MQLQRILHTITFIIVSLTILIRLISAQQDDQQRFFNCSGSDRLFSCGSSIRDVGYPFWGGDRPRECGDHLFELRCARENQTTTIDINGGAFLVQSINTTNNSMRLARLDLLDDFCPDRFENTRLDPLLRYTRDVEDLTLLYGCPFLNIPDSEKFSFRCGINGGENRLGYVMDGSVLRIPMFRDMMTGCESNITVPVLSRAVEEFGRNETTMEEVLRQGFEVEYQMNGVDCATCERSGGLCWSTNANATCLCRGGLRRSVCPGSGSGLNLGRKIVIGIGAAAFSAIIMCIIFYIYHRRYKKCYRNSSISYGSSSHCPSLIKDLEKAGVHIFEYHELEQATDHFNPKRELGDGGYGTVYKGKLQDGRVVAVKKLYEHHFKRVEQFINEIQILTKLKHQNLVSLYGCTSRYSKDLLLVYEYIPNGTLADHLHGPRSKPGNLSWITRLNIAIETANALAYLHASDVVHRDIKSSNILLDNNFTVKVADFGLSRLLPADVTHVSTGPQGTPGYVDPEYSEYYQLTEKSDVYSFGVVLIELISSMPALDITRSRNEINLSTMAICKIQNHALGEIVDSNLGFDSDYKVRAMIVAAAEVAFRCLQSRREMRPHMEDVLSGLQEIQSRGYSTDVVDVPADYIILLKNNSTPNSTGSDP